MATKSKKKTKIEIAKNEDPQEEPVTMMPEEEEGPEVGIEDLTWCWACYRRKTT